jgi:hypothetical protein
VKDPSVLTQHPNSVYTISTPGAVVENKIFSRQVVIAADNVTIRNCLREGTVDYWGFLVNAGVTGTLIENVEIDGKNSSSIDAGIGGNGGWTGRRLNIHGTNDGVKLDSDILLEDSYIHDLAVNNSGAHQDGMQSMGGSNVTIRHNRIKARVGANQNAGVFLATDFSPLDNYKTENNWISGGGYSYWTAVKSGRPITNFVLSDNHFTRNDYAYGVVSIQGQVSRSGNVWHDNLEPIPGG